MAQMYKSGETVSFKYNAGGLRVQKVATSTGTTNYTLHGKNIVHMTLGSNTLHFFYDANNKPAIVEYNGTKYAYVHNLQGDIVAILDSNGTAVVQYKYDAWGKPISKTGTMAATLGKLNPFRYRGYVYDEETGLYYLRSRYYFSAWCRMLNADVLPKGNAFAYCMDSPVAYADYDGFACVCCFDDNGFETPLTVLAMGIGGGGNAVLAGYAAINNAPRYKKKFEKALQDAENVGKMALRFFQNAIAWVKDAAADIVAFLKSLVVTSRTHTIEYMLNGGPLFGKIGVSVTTTLYKSSDPGFLYAFYESNNLDNTIGIGINLGGVLGAHVGISGDFNVFAGAQITPWFHISASVGFDGVGVAIGLDYEDVSGDFEIKCGLGLALAVVAIGIGIPLPAALAPA